MKELDDLDKALLDRVNATQCSSIRDVIRPFLLQRSESVLRDRVRALELRELIKTTRTKREVLCFGVVGLKMAAPLDRHEEISDCANCKEPVNEDGMPPCYVTDFCPQTERKAWQAEVDRAYEADCARKGL